MFGIYKDMDKMNVIESLGEMSIEKHDKLGILTAFATDNKLRNKASKDNLLHPYYRMRLLNELCRIHNIFHEGTWLCAIHTNDYKGYSLYKLHIEEIDDVDTSIFENTKCDDSNIVELCDKIAYSYDDEIPEILNEYFG